MQKHYKLIYLIFLFESFGIIVAQFNESEMIEKWIENFVTNINLSGQSYSIVGGEINLVCEFSNERHSMFNL